LNYARQIAEALEAAHENRPAPHGVAEG
jgi:hypothetical protein